MIIRQDQSADYEEVYEVVKKSFATSTNEGNNSLEIPPRRSCDYFTNLNSAFIFTGKNGMTIISENYSKNMSRRRKQ